MNATKERTTSRHIGKVETLLKHTKAFSEGQAANDSEGIKQGRCLPIHRITRSFNSFRISFAWYNGALWNHRLNKLKTLPFKTKVYLYTCTTCVRHWFRVDLCGASDKLVMLGSCMSCGESCHYMSSWNHKWHGSMPKATSQATLWHFFPFSKDAGRVMEIPWVDQLSVNLCNDLQWPKELPLTQALTSWLAPICGVMRKATGLVPSGSVLWYASKCCTSSMLLSPIAALKK